MDVCILGFLGADAGLIILGDTFLRSFISVYDFENLRVGLAPHLYSKGTITEAPYKMQPWLIAVISISSLLVLILIIVVICKFRKNKKSQYKDIGETNDSLIHGTRV